MSKKYPEFSGLNLPQLEAEILASWKSEQAFEKSVSLREGKTPFVFYEGPPSANGMPGIHHVISRTLKDMVCRYKTMQGFQVKRKGGWDTHGLPVELGVEKELGITKEDIGKKISIEQYNQKCREAVLRYKKEWDDITNKMGYWVDLNNPYITFENNYIETLWWILSTLYKKGYLYQSVSIQPYSPAAGTGLSSHELNQPGTYKDVKDTSTVAMFKAIKNADSQFLFDTINAVSVKSKEIFYMAWTTTPWTLPSNLGLTVGPHIEYVLVATYNPYTAIPVNVVLAKNLISKYFKEEGEGVEGFAEGDKIIPWKIIATHKGSELNGLRYEQLMPFEANDPKTFEGDPFKIVLGDFVTTEDGTGIVHTSPAFGADDYKVGQKNNLGILTLVDREGKFVEGVGEFSGRFVKNYKDEKDYQDVNVDISIKLKKENRAFKVEKYEHNYPHCWRTDKPILYYPLDAWFIKTTAVKDRLVELNKTINWKPKSTGEGRFGNWLENMVDWNLSRSRYWGTPLPIWRTEDGTEELCIGSIEELTKGFLVAKEKGLNKEVNLKIIDGKLDLDLHKPFVDQIELVSSSGQTMKRVSDLVDVWFDSGAMPYAQWHYPFENKDLIDKGQAFPADFICEGVDQTRGWFYTLHTLGVLLFDSVAYKAVMSNGLVLDKNGNKMSKRLGNVVNPFETIEKYGADATRWYLVTNASPWDNLKFDMSGIQEVQRKFFGTLYNTYQFFVLYANVDDFHFEQATIPLADRPEIDRWIISSLHTLIHTVTTSMDDFEPTTAGRAIETFVDEHLSNWYVRLCRRRFWKGSYTQDKIAAYQTLYECIETIAKLMAPIAPFFADQVFRNLNSVTQKHNFSSIHHAPFPIADKSKIDTALELRMQMAQDICSLVLSIRKKVNIKVRQPLQKILIPVLDPATKTAIALMEELILAEVNVKEINYITETEGVISKKVKANFKLLGAKLGTKMKQASAVIANLSQAQITSLEKEGSLALNIEGETIQLLINEVDIIAEDIPGWSVAVKNALTVALDISISPELLKEGNARELVNRVQNIRKESNFELTDKILLEIEDNTDLKESIIQFSDYICREILAIRIDFLPVLKEGVEVDINDQKLRISVRQKG
ncbi:MAG: isoleucine--tRNA ligase [Chitinophagia bacterium]|nr:isoleucine--tRNA ligase [Chitinophagia bacterium]NDD15557.1 isoleucine--tRNA ligase [Chitinophagia bacterium]